MSKQRKMFHTQGFSTPYLTEPIPCTRDDAWLGHGMYFWNEENDAVSWGINGKKNFKKYSVYTAEIECENVLDTVFDEEHYDFWFKSIEKAVDALTKKAGRKPTIADVNEYFLERGGWGDKVTGIMFQDLPSNETISKVTGLYYRKRIQLVAYTKEIIANFAHHFDGDC
ncbi:hypothetical protein VRU48_06925 [Pedobacter sp. KR3-3]|uniref:Uncharacterized protein n=1 Tax=Pedobacter albus TaxID=3113905 RepID=A0ABU7I6A0_9SPHI|nr:hypothetical protein [Pedobacter sp. KR3-3]MEE1944831.1 hypothetical protein [Pedobacter sp. KR3-3]